MNFFTLLSLILFSGSPSLSACIYFPGLPRFPITTVSLPPFFSIFFLLLSSFYSPSFLTLPSSLYPCLFCIVHRASLPPDLDSYANCEGEYGADGRTWRLVRVRVYGRGHLEQRNGIFTQHIMRLAFHA